MPSEFRIRPFWQRVKRIPYMWYRQWKSLPDTPFKDRLSYMIRSAIIVLK